MIILILRCSNKQVDREMKKLIPFDTREQAEKEAYKLSWEGAH